jgi:tetratricopeptide (TPR) repeat protein
MPDAEYKPYNDSVNNTTATPQAKAASIEAYLAAFPQSCAKLDSLVMLMQTYYAANDYPKTLDAADRVLQLDPNNLRALLLEAAIRKGTADSIADPTAKQAALDAGAAAAQKGLAAPKPAAMADADFKTLQSTAFPFFYSAIGTAALNKKDTATAIDAFKKELAAVPLAQTQAPGPILQDTYFLAEAYVQSTPPDLLNCAFYAARFVDYAPEPYKSQIAPTAKYCYRNYHGADDGYDAVAASAKANLFPPPDFQASVKPAPTPKDIIDQIFATTPDLGTLAVGDKEFIIQNGTPDQASKVWDTIKGKSVEIPGALVIAATPTQLQVAISDNAVQSKTADFTFNMAPPAEIPEPKAGATPAQKLAYKKKVADAQKEADAIAAATTVGSTVTLDGTYDSFTAKPIMIIMSDGAVVLPKPKPAAAPVHHTTPAHK